MRKIKRLVVIGSMALLISGVASSSPWPPPWPPYTPHATVEKTGSYTYWCNGGEPINIRIDVRQRIHQWLYIHWEPIRIEWDVYKPGWYATNCLYSRIMSNGNVRLIFTNNCPGTPTTPRHFFFISGSHPGPYPVPDVVVGLPEIVRIINDLNTRNLMLIPVVAPTQTRERALLGCRSYVLKLWNVLRVGFHTRPGIYDCHAMITIIKEGELIPLPKPEPPVPILEKEEEEWSPTPGPTPIPGPTPTPPPTS